MSQVLHSSLRGATPADEQIIRRLLESNGLPTSDLATARPEFLIASQDGEILGIGALERFGDAALLRSIAVATEWRRSGVGRQIVTELEQRARAAGIGELILLTLAAQAFFARLGYSVRDRAQVPPAILKSTEFRSLCPASAVCMGKALTPN